MPSSLQSNTVATVSDVCGMGFVLVAALFLDSGILLLLMLSLLLLYAESHADSQSWKPQTLLESRMFTFKHFGGHFV